MFKDCNFRVRCNNIASDKLFKDIKIDRYEMVSTKIMNINSSVGCGYLEYFLGESNSSRGIYVSVTVDKINSKYEIISSFIVIEGELFKDFVGYLEENHERNIVELSI